MASLTLIPVFNVDLSTTPLFLVDGEIPNGAYDRNVGEFSDSRESRRFD